VSFGCWGFSWHFPRHQALTSSAYMSSLGISMYVLLLLLVHVLSSCSCSCSRLSR